MAGATAHASPQPVPDHRAGGGRLFRHWNRGSRRLGSWTFFFYVNGLARRDQPSTSARPYSCPILQLSQISVQLISRICLLCPCSIKTPPPIWLSAVVRQLPNGNPLFGSVRGIRGPKLCFSRSLSFRRLRPVRAARRYRPQSLRVLTRRRLPPSGLVDHQA